MSFDKSANISLNFNPFMHNGKQCRPKSDAIEHGVWSGSTLIALSSELSTKHDNNNN